MTHEEILRDADEAAKRVIWGGNYGTDRATVGVVGLHAGMQAQAAQAPSCAHLIVGYVRQALGSGRERGWWQCTECDMRFVPSGTSATGANAKY